MYSFVNTTWLLLLYTLLFICFKSLTSIPLNFDYWMCVCWFVVTVFRINRRMPNVAVCYQPERTFNPKFDHFAWGCYFLNFFSAFGHSPVNRKSEAKGLIIYIEDFTRKMAKSKKVLRKWPCSIRFWLKSLAPFSTENCQFSTFLSASKIL